MEVWPLRKRNRLKTVLAFIYSRVATALWLCTSTFTGNPDWHTIFWTPSQRLWLGFRLPSQLKDSDIKAVKLKKGDI